MSEAGVRRETRGRKRGVDDEGSNGDALPVEPSSATKDAPARAPLRPRDINQLGLPVSPLPANSQQLNSSNSSNAPHSPSQQRGARRHLDPSAQPAVLLPGPDLSTTPIGSESNSFQEPPENVEALASILMSLATPQGKVEFPDLVIEPTTASTLPSPTQAKSLFPSENCQIQMENSLCPVQLRTVGKKRYMVRPAPKLSLKHVPCCVSCRPKCVRAVLVSHVDGKDNISESELDGNKVELDPRNPLQEVLFPKLCILVMPKLLSQNGSIKFRFLLDCVHDDKPCPNPPAYADAGPEFRLVSNYKQMSRQEHKLFTEARTRRSSIGGSSEQSEASSTISKRQRQSL